MRRIIVLGSINMDIVSRVAKYPRIGETIKGEDFQYIPGGKGANQAIAAHRLGGKVQLFGKIGKDPFGNSLLQFFTHEGLDNKSITTTNLAPTGAAFVVVNNVSENIIFVSGGANDKLSLLEFGKLNFSKFDIVSATLETPIAVTKEVFKEAKKSGTITVLNAAPPIMAGQEIFPFTDYLILNETELSSFAHSEIRTTKEEVVASMYSIKGKMEINIITTLGKRGAVGIFNKQTVALEGHAIDAVDTTAAGDCFTGAFVTALQEGKSVKESMSFANAAAAVSVLRRGASSSLPFRKDVEVFLSRSGR